LALIYFLFSIFYTTWNCCRFILWQAHSHTHTPRTPSTLNAHKRSAMMSEYDWLTTAAKTSAFATKTRHRKMAFSAQQWKSSD